jgi:hypothetical protein
MKEIQQGIPAKFCSKCNCERATKIYGNDSAVLSHKIVMASLEVTFNICTKNLLRIGLII